MSAVPRVLRVLGMLTGIHGCLYLQNKLHFISYCLTVDRVCFCSCFQPSFKQIGMRFVSLLHLWHLPFYLSLFVSLNWRLHFVQDSESLSVGARVSLKPAYQLAGFTPASCIPDLSWRGVPTCLGDILNDWKFFSPHEDSSPTSLQEGVTLDLLTSCDSSLPSLSCCIGSHNGFPINASTCGP